MRRSASCDRSRCASATPSPAWAAASATSAEFQLGPADPRSAELAIAFDGGLRAGQRRLGRDYGDLIGGQFGGQGFVLQLEQDGPGLDLGAGGIGDGDDFAADLGPDRCQLIGHGAAGQFHRCRDGVAGDGHHADLGRAAAPATATATAARTLLRGNGQAKRKDQRRRLGGLAGDQGQAKAGR